jgi:predicted nuclease of predicted toxin-antitoxin system
MRPGWLLNENFPMPAVDRLRAAGWDVVAVAECSASAADPDVMALAREQGRWLATFDRDYGELVFRRRFPPPPLVLLLRVETYQPEEPADWIETLYAVGELREGHFHIFNGRAVRRRPLLPPMLDQPSRSAPD